MREEKLLKLKDIEGIIHDEINWAIIEESKLKLSDSDDSGISYYHGLNSGLNCLLSRLGLPEYKIWYKREE